MRHILINFWGVFFRAGNRLKSSEGFSSRGLHYWLVSIEITCPILKRDNLEICHNFPAHKKNFFKEYFVIIPKVHRSDIYLEENKIEYWSNQAQIAAEDKFIKKPSHNFQENNKTINHRLDYKNLIQLIFKVPDTRIVFRR